MSQSILGRIIWPEAIAELRSEFGLAGVAKLGADDVIRGASATNDIELPVMHGARLKMVTVNGSRRLEIRDYRPEERERIKARGAFSEVIAYKTRLFVPVDRADAVLNAMIGARRFCLRRRPSITLGLPESGQGDRRVAMAFVTDWRL